MYSIITALHKSSTRRLSSIISTKNLIVIPTSVHEYSLCKKSQKFHQNLPITFENTKNNAPNNPKPPKLHEAKSWKKKIKNKDKKFHGKKKERRKYTGHIRRVRRRRRDAARSLIRAAILIYQRQPGDKERQRENERRNGAVGVCEGFQRSKSTVLSVVCSLVGVRVRSGYRGLPVRLPAMTGRRRLGSGYLEGDEVPRGGGKTVRTNPRSWLVDAWESRPPEWSGRQSAPSIQVEHFESKVGRVVNDIPECSTPAV